MVSMPRLKIGKQGNIMLAISAIVGIFIIIVAFFGMSAFPFAIEGYSGGWECRTNLDSVYIASQQKWYTASNAPMGDVPWGPKGVQFDPTSQTDYPTAWDVVQEPDINVMVDDPIHASEDSNHNLKTDTAGKVVSTPENEYVRTITKTVGADTFVYTHHVYATIVTVKTQADMEDLHFLGNANLETKGEEGVALTFTVRFAFIVDPWNIVGKTFTEGNTTYQITKAFAGVMASSVEVVKSGFTDRTMQARLEDRGQADVLVTVGTGWDITKPEVHQACNMYTTTGSSAQQASINYVPSDPSTIEGVPNKVYIDVSGSLYAGAHQELFILPTAYNLFMQVTVRIDVLTSAKFTPVVGTDPLTDPPDDVTVGPAPFWYPLAYALGQIWGSYWWIIVVFVVIVFAFLVLIILTRLKALFRGGSLM